MDIMLERMLSLIPRKPDGKYVHGAKKEFCEKIGAPTNIISEWESGKTRSYRRYVYVVAQVYDVSVEWLRGETDEKGKPPVIDGRKNTYYAQLTPENKKYVEILVAKLLASQSQD